MVVSLFLFLHYKGLSCKLSTIFLQFSAKFAKLPFICGKCTYSDIKTSKNIFLLPWWSFLYRSYIPSYGGLPLLFAVGFTSVAKNFVMCLNYDLTVKSVCRCKNCYLSSMRGEDISCNVVPYLAPYLSQYFFACLINALCERGMVTLHSAHLPVVTLRANRRIAILTDMRKIVLRIASPLPILREQQNM